MIRPPEDWQSIFNELQKIRIGVGSLIGFLKRYLKKRIREASPQELLRAEIELWQWARIAARSEGARTVSMGKLRVEWTGHPLYKLLFDESIRREKEKEKEEGDKYLGPFSDLSENEIRDYLTWKGDKHGSIQEWRRDRKRSLPVIPSNLVGDGKETQKNNRLISSSGIESQNEGPSRESRLQGKKTTAKENRAYGPYKKG